MVNSICLPQAGVVLAYQNTKKTHQFSAAFIEQRYHQLTDRRFSYFQYNGILANKLFCFGSAELDHYSKTDSSTSNQIRLTSIYSQVRYRFSRKISASISYDNRKNVIYYETYFHIIDQLLAQETRQGFRAQVSWQIFKNVSLNLSQFLRFQGHSKPNKTFLAYLYLPNLLKSKINCSLQFQNLETDYIKGLTYGGRISRDLFKSKANIELSYRINQYNYLNQENKINQHILGTTLYLYLSRRLYFSMNFEWDKTPTVQSQRMFTSINYRFDNKKNKVNESAFLFSFAIFALMSCNSKPKVVEEVSKAEPPIQKLEAQTEMNASAKGPVGADVHQVVAKETLETERYTYILVTENKEEFWIAVAKRDIKIGNTYYYRNGLKKTDFYSQEFKRTFPVLYLVGNIIDQSEHPGGIFLNLPLLKIQQALQLKLNQSTFLIE